MLSGGGGMGYGGHAHIGESLRQKKGGERLGASASAEEGRFKYGCGESLMNP